MAPLDLQLKTKQKPSFFHGLKLHCWNLRTVFFPVSCYVKHLSFLPFTFTRAHNMLTIPDSLPSDHLSSFQTCCLLTEATNDAKEPPWSLIFSRASCSTWHTAYTVQCHTCQGREVEHLLLLQKARQRWWPCSCSHKKRSKHILLCSQLYPLPR